MNLTGIIFLLMVALSGISAPASQPQSAGSMSPSSYNSTLRQQYEKGMQSRIERPAYWDSLLAASRQLHDTALEYEIYYQQAGMYLRSLNKPERANEALQQAMQLAQAAGNRQQQADIILKMIGQRLYASDTRKAIELCFQGLKLSEAGKDRLSEARFYAQLAAIYKLQGEMTKSLAMQMKCLPLFRRLDRHYELAGCLLDIGTLYGAMNDAGKKADYYLAAEPYVSEFRGTAAGCEIEVAVATAYRIRGNFEKDNEYLKLALADARLIHCRNCEASIFTSWGMSQVDQGHMKQAEQLLLQALAITEEIGFKAQKEDLLETLTYIYEKQGRYAESLRTYKQYIGIRDSLSDKKDLKLAMEKEFAYGIEKKEHENQLLVQQNEIQLLELKQNRYFIAALIGLAVFVVVIAVLLVRQNRLQEAQQRMTVEQKLLRAQMNPHFIFNSLQAIQGFILKQDTRAAVKYLSAFSTITRTVLESSRTDEIPLEKEMKLLGHYLELQQLRFGGRFTYSIRLDDTLMSAPVNIPPMLAQPFIENAIEHGMAGIESGGHIDLLYAVHEGSLCITITDNGSGMLQADAAAKQHRSMAMQITRERIALIGKKENRQATLEVRETYPEAAQRKGVTVSIGLPLA